jgi:hypothetical protein
MIGGSLLYSVDTQAVSSELGYEELEDERMSGYDRRSIIR